MRGIRIFTKRYKCDIVCHALNGANTLITGEYYLLEYYMSQKLIRFSNDALGEITGTMKDGSFWFSASQVCKCLGVKNYRDSVSSLISRHSNRGVEKHDTLLKSIKMSVDTGGGVQRIVMVNEPALYALIFRSNKDKAIDFQEWVFSDVLPSLRKHGQYRMDGKIIRHSLTDALKDSGENERMHGHGYTTYTKMIYKSLGLPNKVDRDSLTSHMLEKLARKENVVSAMIQDGKVYSEIKDFILT